MFDRPPKETPAWSWVFVVLWALTIYITIFFGRAIQSFVVATWGPGAFLVAVGASLVVAVAAAVRWLVVRETKPGLDAYAWLALIVGIYVAGTWELRHNPEEALHFVQYGVLSLLVYRALVHRTRDPLVFPAAAVVTACFGAVDEAIQWLVPRRFFDYRDIWINVLGACLMQLAISLGIRPLLPRGPIAPASVRRLARASAALSLIFLLLLSNTPAARAVYNTWPVTPGFVKRVDETMTSYGHRLRSPKGLAISSHLTREEMQRIDEREAARYGAILNRFQGEGGYKRFMETPSVWTEPLLPEVRIRLFRRDRHLQLAIAAKDDPVALRRHATIVWREQQILDLFTPNTYAAATGYQVPRWVFREVGWHADQESRYVSPVHRELITSFTQAQVVALLCLLILGCIVTDRVARRVEVRHANTT